jgi:hypothetical protein
MMDWKIRSLVEFANLRALVTIFFGLDGGADLLRPGLALDRLGHGRGKRFEATVADAMRAVAAGIEIGRFIEVGRDVRHDEHSRRFGIRGFRLAPIA